MNILKKYTQKDRYGNMFSYEFDVPSMQEIPKPEGQQEVDPSVFKPKGTDTVPAMLTPGENVVNAEASRLPGVQPMLDELNDMGRAIQKKQGGPIPSYADKGKYIGQPTGKQTIVGRDIYSSPMTGPMGNLVGSKNASEQGATIKRGDQYGNIPSIYNGMQYNEDQLLQMMKDKNINMPNAYYDNPITATEASKMRSRALDGQNVMGMEHTQPRYKQEGGFVIDDTMLDAIKQVESGGDPNALSGVGAGGQYQIMPATAQQPGYGVTPISLEDRFDPNKSRAFAKQYLEGIMRANPDFTRDEVITAYHSGVGNVRKAKMGQEELGLRGQEYAGKVNAAMGEVPIVETAMSEVPLPEPRPVVFDDTPMESGFMSAQASTGDKEVPGVETTYNPFNPEFYKEGQLGDLNQLKRALGYPLEIFGMGLVPESAPGKDPGTIFDVVLPDPSPDKYKEINDKYQIKIKENKLNSSQKELDAFNKRMKEQIENGIQPTSEDLKTKEKLENDLKEKKEDLDNYNKRIVEFEKEKKIKQEKIDKSFGFESEEDKIKREAKEKRQKEAAKAISDQLANEEDIDQTVMTNEEVAEYMRKNPGKTPTDKFIDKAKEVGGFIVDKSMEYFKNAFSSMFDGEELARMALIYAGSRAMGYNHGASLNYGMKSYIKRVDANLAAAKKFALTEKARDDFTLKSLKKYAMTGDISVLERKAADTSATGFKGELYHRDFGKLQIIERANKIDGVRIPANVARDLQRQGVIPADADVSNGFDVGINHPLIKGKTAKLNPSFHDATTMRTEFTTVAKANLDAVNAIDKGSKMKKIQESPTEIANEAQKILTKGLKHFKVIDDSTAALYRREVDSAISDYYQALRTYYNNKENGVDDKKNPKPTGIEGYFNKRILPLKTESIIQPQDIAKTSPENLLELEKLILRESGTKDPRRYMDIWEGAKEQWLSMKSYGSYSNNLADPGWDGFTLWLFDMNQPKPKKDATRLLDPSNLK